MILLSLIQALIVLVPALLGVAFLTLLDRKVMASIQLRRGPNFVGLGYFQPLADGLKLLIKEVLIPVKSNKLLFLLAPLISLFLSLSAWAVVPFGSQVFAHLNLGVIFLLAISSLAVYGIILSGWASNSRYAFLGSIRSAAQMISYEIVLGLLMLLVCLQAQSLNFLDLVQHQRGVWFILPTLPFFLMYLIAVIAETNRAPFDLPEAEAELVSGYNVEYSSAPFAFFFIAEYSSLLLWSNITVNLFLGGWLAPFEWSFFPSPLAYFLKLFFMLFLFSWIRAAFPRYRWDQLMFLTWRILLPLTLGGSLFFFLFFWSVHGVF